MPALWARSRGERTRLVGLTWIEERQTVLVAPGSGIRGADALRGLRLAVPRHDIAIDFWRAMALRGFEGALASAGLALDELPDARFRVNNGTPRPITVHQRLLDDAGLSYADDITAVRSDDDSEQLVRTGEIAAWVAQGDRLAAARRTGGLRTLIRTGDVISDRSVFFTRRDLAESRPEVIEALTRALRRAADWAAAHPRQAAEIASADLGGSADDWETALETLPWTIEPVTDAFIAEQQEAADIFHRTGFIERPVTVGHARARTAAEKAV